MDPGPLFGYIFHAFLCFLDHLAEHHFCIDLLSIFGWILMVCLMFFDTFSIRARNLLNLQKQLFFLMNSNDFTILENMIFDDFHIFFRYKFWH